MEQSYTGPSAGTLSPRELSYTEQTTMHSLSKLRGMDSLSVQGCITHLLATHPQQVFFRDTVADYTGLAIANLATALSSFLGYHSPRKQRVAVLLPLGSQQASVIIALLSLGHSVIVLDPSTATMGLGNRLQSLGVSTALVSSIRAELGITQIVLSEGLLLFNESTPPAADQAKVPDDELIGLSSSGSTGAPKTILLSERNIAYIVGHIIERFGLNCAHDKAYIQLPLFHTLAFNTQLLPSFFAGMTCVFAGSEKEIQHSYRNILANGCTFLSLMPSLLNALDMERERRGLAPLYSVRVVQIAGGTIGQKDLETARRIFPLATIFKGYGLTELARVSMISSDDPDFATDTLGRVLPGQVVRIVGPDGSPCAEREIGEICIKGPNILRSYGDGTSPRLDVDGFFSTGDLGYLDEKGLLFYSGRMDHVFKSLGKKIAPFEIEKVANLHRLVSNSCCLPLPCPKKGLRPVLIVEAQFQDWSADEFVDFATHVKLSLDAYKIPKTILFTDLIPCLANGKINRVKMASQTELLLERHGPLACHGGISMEALRFQH